MKDDCGRRTRKKLLIDGSNVQGRDINDNADLDRLVALCLGVFKEGYDFIVYLDANTRHFYPDNQTKTRLDILLSEFPELFIECPGKTEADDFILNHAYESNLPILTNDQYRDWRNVHPFVVLDRSRFLRFSLGGGVINIPSLGLLVSLSTKGTDFNELWSVFSARTVRILDSEGNFVACKHNTGILESNRATARDRTKFRLVDRGNSQFTLLASNRRYVSADITRNSTLVADRKTPGEWESFTLQETESGVFLRAHNQQFVSVRRDEGGLLRACAVREDLWERFTIEDFPESIS